uniref:Bcl-2 Bcl-2 homology region 1-3 domain-containing protein n=1 Tax=Denticeps clupeoides TaxID=299321 RepID=A0AAY4DNJ8_9TELE
VLSKGLPRGQVNELKRVIGGEVPLLAQFPLNVQYEKLVFELTENMESISDTLRNNTDMIDKIAQQRNPDILAKAAEMVFSDGVVNWGRIIVLLYTARRLSVKLWIAFEPEAGLDIFTSTLAYFKNILLAWIVKMGGWVTNESNSASTASKTRPVQHVSFLLRFRPTDQQPLGIRAVAERPGGHRPPQSCRHWWPSACRLSAAVGSGEEQLLKTSCTTPSVHILKCTTKMYRRSS